MEMEWHDTAELDIPLRNPDEVALYIDEEFQPTLEATLKRSPR